MARFCAADLDPSIIHSVMYAPVPTDYMRDAVPSPVEFTSSREPKEICHNFRTDFTKNVRGWKVENNLPYNELAGRGPTLNATTYMRYGKVSADIRSASIGGAVTAFILIADGGDEIDFEILGGDPHHAQTNYFYGPRAEYAVNGGVHNIPGSPLDSSFHKYTIDWQPDKIDWLIDDQIIRTKWKKDTCDSTGLCRYPSHPARIQFGLWDGSTESTTAEWAKGPIDWTEHSSITAYVKDLQVDCNPDYNQIVD
ncbi:glycoside hydrolase family 16 protein [Backusella circina FSU 941]|nr:glycoside hydrolase family 16 protein [Backusella circina FSU 941]